MAHRYQLFREVEARCRCCHRYERLTFTSAYDQVICPRCTSHVGDAPSMVKRRDAEHVTLWESDVASWRQHYEGRILTLQTSLRAEEERHASEIQSLNIKVSDLEGALKAGLDARPVESMALWYEQTQVSEANDRTAQARAYISLLFRLLLGIDADHHEDDKDERDGMCSCGTRMDDCAVFKRMDEIRDRLYKWEHDEIDRARRGQRHNLPAWHLEAKHYAQYNRPA